MGYTHSVFGRGLIHAAVGALVLATACRGGETRREVNVASGALDTAAVRQFRTFSLKSPTGSADTVGVVGTTGENRVTGAVMDMDPMISTSLVGRAIRADLSDAFTKRGYQATDATPDFNVFYY